MASKPIIAHGVQLFVLARGKLAQGRYIECKGEAEACRVAEDKVRNGRAAGAAAFARTIIDRDYDDGSEPITLATFGEVPLAFADQIPF